MQIALSKEASARLMGIPLGLYSENREAIARRIAEAWSKFIRWERLAELETARWPYYQLKAGEAYRRWQKLDAERNEENE